MILLERQQLVREQGGLLGLGELLDEEELIVLIRVIEDLYRATAVGGDGGGRFGCAGRSAAVRIRGDTRLHAGDLQRLEVLVHAKGGSLDCCVHQIISQTSTNSNFPAKILAGKCGHEEGEVLARRRRARLHS